jgi:hypothetical protein
MFLSAAYLCFSSHEKHRMALLVIVSVGILNSQNLHAAEDETVADETGILFQQFLVQTDCTIS